MANWFSTGCQDHWMGKCNFFLIKKSAETTRYPQDKEWV